MLCTLVGDNKNYTSFSWDNFDLWPTVYTEEQGSDDTNAITSVLGAQSMDGVGGATGTWTFTQNFSGRDALGFQFEILA